MKRVAFKTVGCRLNQAETARMAAQFEAASYQVVPFGEAAEVCVIHSCAVTHNAEKNSLRLARSCKRSQPGAMVVLAGCAVEVARARLGNESCVDLLADQEAKFHLPELVARAAHCHAPGPHPASASRPALSHLLPRFSTTRALIKIQDGCEFCCAYCIVPAARGRSTSRPIGEILEEIHGLSSRGYREVVLTGANLGCYQDNSCRLPDLIERIEAIDGVDRIRLSSIEVSTVERPIIDYMAASSKLCRYLHIPLQSGDDRILSSMGRRYTVREYRQLIDYLMAKVPVCGLGADVVTGLPGEDINAFENTATLIEDLPFTNLHVFPYSNRPGTRAEVMPDQVPQDERKRRAHLLLSLGRDKAQKFAERLVGTPVSLLVEEVTDGTGTGWTGEYVRGRMSRDDLEPNQILEFTPSVCVDGVLTE